MKRELKAAQESNTPVKDLHQYVGRYYNKVSTFYLDIVYKDDQIWLAFGDQGNDLFEFSHYNYDVFSWILTRDENVRHGRFPVTRADFYLLHFKCDNEDDLIDTLVWHSDPTVSDGEVLKKSIHEVTEPEPVVKGPF